MTAALKETARAELERPDVTRAHERHKARLQTTFDGWDNETAFALHGIARMTTDDRVDPDDVLAITGGHRLVMVVPQIEEAPRVSQRGAARGAAGGKRCRASSIKARPQSPERETRTRRRGR